MSRQLLIRSLVLTVVVCLVTVWVDVRITFGFLLGAIGSVLLYLRSVAFCNAVLSEKKTKHLRTFARFMQSYAIMAVILIVSAAKPEILNVFASAIGLMLIKFCLILETFYGKEGKG